MKKILCFTLLILCAPAYHLSHSTRGLSTRHAKHSFCGTYPGQIHDELRRFQELRSVVRARKSQMSQMALGAVSGATQDVNNIAVIEDDGNIVTDANRLDLAGKDLKL